MVYESRRYFLKVLGCLFCPLDIFENDDTFKDWKNFYDVRNERHLTITDENYRREYNRIKGLGFSENEKENLRELALYNFRYNTRDDDFREHEVAWLQIPNIKKGFTRDFAGYYGIDRRHYLNELVSFSNPSQEDAVFLLRYWNVLGSPNFGKKERIVSQRIIDRKSELEFDDSFLK